MELILLLLVIFTWITYRRSVDARSDIDKLKNRIARLEEVYRSGAASHTIVKAAESLSSVSNPSSYDHGVQPLSSTASAPTEARVPRTYFNDRFTQAKEQLSSGRWLSKIQGGFEQDLATKLPVWIGAICLILSAFFLVKYSIDAGWLGPVVRTILGGAFGGILIYVGRFISLRAHIPNHLRISQGLIGAGLVSLYVSIYAAINLYHFLPPSVGFVSMVAVTTMAVILSLRHGPSIAVFGLIGGIITPALIGSKESNLIGLLIYIFLLFSGFFYILVKQGWLRLALFTIIAAFFWPTLWFSFAFKDELSIFVVLFSVAITAVVLSITGKFIKEAKPHSRHHIHVLNFVAVAFGTTTLIWLSSKITLTFFDWSMMGLLSAAVMGLTFFQPDTYMRALWIKVAATLILFFVWAISALLSHALIVAAGLIGLYIIIPIFIMRCVKDPRVWAGLQSVAAVSLFLICYAAFKPPQQFLESFPNFWGSLSLVLSAIATYQVSKARSTLYANLVIQDHLLAVYALTASSFISLGLAIELPWGYLPLALAAQLAATAWVFHRLQITHLKSIMMILSVLIVILNYEQILLFINLLFFGALNQVPLSASINNLIIDLPLVKLGLPALFSALAFWFVYKKEPADCEVLPAVFMLSGFFVLATIYYEVRGLFLTASTVHPFTTASGFIERGMITGLCAVAAIMAFYIYRRIELSYIKSWAICIFSLAALRYIYFDFLLENPYWSKDQNVGNLIVLNGISLTYGGAALFAVWAVLNKDVIGSKSSKLDVAYKIFGFTALFLFITFNIRQVFHDEFLHHSFMTTIPELYSYSVIWLLTGLGLLGIGIVRSNKSARMASLGFMILTILKVFLVDAAELDGLLRVISFLGLGMSLIGLSVFYTKFVFKTKANIE